MWGHGHCPFWSSVGRHIQRLASSSVIHTLLQEDNTKYCDYQLWIFPHQQLWCGCWRLRNSVFFQPYSPGLQECGYGVCCITNNYWEMNTDIIALKIGQAGYHIRQLRQICQPFQSQSCLRQDAETRNTQYLCHSSQCNFQQSLYLVHLSGFCATLQPSRRRPYFTFPSNSSQLC